MITQTIDLNMIPDSPPVVVHVDQYDHGAGRIVAHLYNGDQLYTPTGTAWIQGTKPDGKGFQYSATLSGSTVTAELTEQMTAVAGNVRTQIVVNETNGRIGTFCFTLAVQKSGLPADTDMSQSEYQIVEELIEEVIGASTHAPIIGQNGNWWVWNVEADDYVDSGVDATITVRIADITMLEPGATPYVTNTGTNTDPIFHLFIPRGTKGDTGEAAGFGTPTATIDGSTGTPSVQVTASGSDTAKVFDFAFHNLKGTKGDTGEKGDPGDMPTITATGSVDSNVGVPSVNVTQSGTAANPVLNFAFHNMKGADGGGTTTYRNGGIVVVPPMPTIVTWANGTDAEIAAMLAAHYAGVLNIHDYWNVGDERTVHLDAMAATGVDESHAAQDVIMVLMNEGGKTLVNPINSFTECAFIVGQKNGLDENGYLNATSMNAGGWNACARRTWCNSVYKNALPNTLVGIFKEHQNITGNGGNPGSTPITSDDYFALPSEKEIFGIVRGANATAEADNTQFEYYETEANRVKHKGNAGYVNIWWQRSPVTGHPSAFCVVDTSGASTVSDASVYYGLAPFGVI